MVVKYVKKDIMTAIMGSDYGAYAIVDKNQDIINQIAKSPALAPYSDYRIDLDSYFEAPNVAFSIPAEHRLQGSLLRILWASRINTSKYQELEQKRNRKASTIQRDQTTRRLKEYVAAYIRENQLKAHESRTREDSYTYKIGMLKVSK
jgi:hypothetical protein